MSLRSSPGLVSGSPHSSTIGSDEIAAEQYRSAKLVFGWSFYRQGTSGGTSSADEFIDAALAWFGDPDPRLGTAWEKGDSPERIVVRMGFH
jgi:hypothetical protein